MKFILLLFAIFLSFSLAQVVSFDVNIFTDLDCTEFGENRVANATANVCTQIFEGPPELWVIFNGDDVFWYIDGECSLELASNTFDNLNETCQFFQGCSFNAAVPHPPPPAFCGDCFVNVGGEECDDCNSNNFDNCTNDCKIPQPTNCSMEDCTCDGGCVEDRSYWLGHNYYQTNCTKKIPWPGVVNNILTENITLCQLFPEESECCSNTSLLALLSMTPFTTLDQLVQAYIVYRLNQLQFEPCDNFTYNIELIEYYLAHRCENVSVNQTLLDDALIYVTNFNNGELFVGPGTCDLPPYNCTEHCHCGYSAGYYGTPRFIDPYEELLPIGQRADNKGGYNSSNADTCKWPTNFGVDRRTQIACHNGTKTVEWFTILNTTYNKINPFYSKKYYDAAQAYIIFSLNIYFGFCSGCEFSAVEQDCQTVSTIAEIFGQLFNDLDSQCTNLSWTDQCSIPECLSLCQKYPQIFTTCTLTAIFNAFNEGRLGAGHCVVDGTQGCCDNGFNPLTECEYDENKFAPNGTILDGASVETATDLLTTVSNSLWTTIRNLDIAILIFAIVILLMLCVLLWFCMGNKW